MSAPFSVHDRVRLKAEYQELGGLIELGTVLTVSEEGYVRLRWDDETSGYFSPKGAALCLEVVTGDDAIRRHVWDRSRDVCERCAVRWTSDITDAPCVPRDGKEAAHATDL